MKTNNLRVIQGGRRKSNKIWRRLFLAGVVALALFLLWNSLGYLALWAADVTVASSKEIVASEPVTCFVLREELTIESPASGLYCPALESGSKIRKGQTIGHIEHSNGTKTPIPAPEAGLILHGIDGYETRFNLKITLDDETLVNCITSYINSSPVPTPASQVKGGDVVGVIITNAGYRLLTALSFHTQGQRQLLEAEDGTTYTLTPRQVIKAQDKFWVLWAVSSLSDTLGKERSFSGQLVSEKEEAVLVPARALCSKDGNQGVLVLFRDKPVFNPVEVLSTFEGQVAVKGLVHGQRVLTLPWWASLAKRWWLR